jgi:uncharacterized membrane protein
MTSLIGAIPCLALNILADHPSQKNVILHYSLPVIPFLILALIASIAADKAWLKQKRAILLWSLIWFLILSKWGFFISKYLNFVDNLQATKEAISLIKTQDSVLTTDVITPHLTHRQEISFKYDINELNNFHYILLNTRHPGWAATAEDYGNLVKELKKRSDFKLQYERDDVYLFTKQ